jgi:dTDP-4-amino-4,6-dideoxygalactose transaminase
LRLRAHGPKYIARCGGGISKTLPRRSKFLPFSPPFIGQEEIDEVAESLRSGWITTGPKAARFEQDFANFVGAESALALNSGTAALHLGLISLGVSTGDLVVSTPMTFASCIHVIEHAGAHPILADIDPETLNIDPEMVERLLSKHPPHTVKAMIPVHLYGHPADMDALMALAELHDIAVVEDAAHALPASYRGQMIGARDPGHPKRLAAFSFYATKNLTTGEGGMLTGKADIIEKARVWSVHGMSRDAYKRYSAEGSWYYEVVAPGFKYNMSDIQAAIGLRQLARLDAMQQRRREIVRLYTAGLRDLDAVTLPVERPEVEHSRHLYAIRLHLDRLSIDRAEFINELRERQIGTSVHFIPIHLHPYYRDKYGYKPEDFPIAYREYQRLISLPLYPRMTDQDAADVIEAVREICVRFRR